MPVQNERYDEESMILNLCLQSKNTVFFLDLMRNDETGIEKVEVEVSSQKVAATGYVHKNKILKAIRRNGLKADFWSPRNEILINAYATGKYGSLRIHNFSFF